LTRTPANANDNCSLQALGEYHWLCWSRVSCLSLQCWQIHLLFYRPNAVTLTTKFLFQIFHADNFESLKQLRYLQVLESRRVFVSTAQWTLTIDGQGQQVQLNTVVTITHTHTHTHTHTWQMTNTMFPLSYVQRM